MKWSRELRIARRSLRTAIKAASSLAGATARLPAPMRGIPWPPSAPHRSSSDLVEVAGFGSNPGRLAMFLHVPPVAPKAGKPLIVLLHGCGQTAAQLLPTPAGSRWPTGWAFLSCYPSNPATTTKADASIGSAPCTFGAGLVRRCRSDRWSIPPSHASIVTRDVYSLRDCRQVAPWPLHCWRPTRTCSPVEPSSLGCRLARRVPRRKPWREWPMRSIAARVMHWPSVCAKQLPTDLPGRGPVSRSGTALRMTSSTQPMPACLPNSGRQSTEPRTP